MSVGQVALVERGRAAVRLGPGARDRARGAPRPSRRLLLQERDLLGAERRPARPPTAAKTKGRPVSARHAVAEIDDVLAQPSPRREAGVADDQRAGGARSRPSSTSSCGTSRKRGAQAPVAAQQAQQHRRAARRAVERDRRSSSTRAPRRPAARCAPAPCRRWRCRGRRAARATCRCRRSWPTGISAEVDLARAQTRRRSATADRTTARSGPRRGRARARR